MVGDAIKVEDEIARQEIRLHKEECAKLARANGAALENISEIQGKLFKTINANDKENTKQHGDIRLEIIKHVWASIGVLTVILAVIKWMDV